MTVKRYWARLDQRNAVPMEMVLASDHEAEVERLREALQRCADYLDTSATCNSDRAMASMARAALKEQGNE